MKLIKDLNEILRGKETDNQATGPLTLEKIDAATWSVIGDIFESANVALWEWHIPEDRVIGTPPLYKILGTAPGDFGNSLYAMIDGLVHPSHQAYFLSALKEALKARAMDRFKIRIVRRDGQERWVMLRGRLLPDGETAVGTLADWTDIQNANLSLHENLDFMQSLLDAIPNPVFYKDTTGAYQFCNPAFTQMLGTSAGNVLGKDVNDIASAELASVYRQKDNELFSSGGTQVYEAPVEVQSGDIRTYHMYKALCHNRQGAASGLVGVMTDITAYADTISRGRRLAHLKEAMLEVSHAIIGLHDSKNLLELLLDKALSAIPSSHAGSVLMIDEAGYLRMLVSRGYSNEGAAGFRLKIEETFTYRISGGRFEEPFIVNDIVSLVADGCLDPLRTEDGRMIASNLSTPITVEGEPVALVIVDSFENHVFTEDDVELMGYLKIQAELALTNLKLYQDALRLSRYDHLTGIYNRGYFDKVLDDFIERTRGQFHPFTFVIMDLDGLKIVNDQLGHREGDFRLQGFTEKIRTVLGEEDIVGRYGGDEFVAVFFGKEEEQVVGKMSGLMAEMEKADRCCSFSFGTAHYPTDGSTHEELIRVADRKLYAHKRAKNFTRRQEDHGHQHQ